MYFQRPDKDFENYDEVVDHIYDQLSDYRKKKIIKVSLTSYKDGVVCTSDTIGTYFFRSLNLKDCKGAPSDPFIINFVDEYKENIFDLYYKNSYNYSSLRLAPLRSLYIIAELTAKVCGLHSLSDMEKLEVATDVLLDDAIDHLRRYGYKLDAQGKIITVTSPHKDVEDLHW